MKCRNKASTTPSLCKQHYSAQSVCFTGLLTWRLFTMASLCWVERRKPKFRHLCAHILLSSSKVILKKIQHDLGGSLDMFTYLWGKNQHESADNYLCTSDRGLTGLALLLTPLQPCRWCLNNTYASFLRNSWKSAGQFCEITWKKRDFIIQFCSIFQKSAAMKAITRLKCY